MSFWKEFKEFAVKGNVVDLAIGVVIGSAFSGIVNSLVKDMIMPVVSLITGSINFDSLSLPLKKITGENGTVISEVVLSYGKFISSIVNFFIIALSIFIVIKQINRFKPKPTPAPVLTKECPYCRTKIHIEATRCPNCTSELK